LNHQLSKLSGLFWLLEFFKGYSCLFKNSNSHANKTLICKKLTKERADTCDPINAPKLAI